ncbi:glycine--tRNA ligase subunit beta [Anaeroglobus geminatus]|jgi:glycyl-tRNA synthetase beta chain|uniref:Glycine--tRNA ligase beta subunit n=1 Tax=Anaeroglobus geminatus F0357 TaxID=861450 RepID=G9YH83_9FIRM|nr:glycine--tRNA ligase subunit beta [Anaeroglobus geminatus]EHM41138.1 glycine--tRNA ligase, beta subunit [Anaeroglobus geminatus F0357]
MSKDLLLEIGTEEIPAHYMPGILKQVKESAAAAFEENRLACEDIRTLGTPRRVTLIVKGLAEKQADVSAKNKGPSVKIAYDADGRPTQAAVGFARSQKIDVADLVVEDGYIYADVTTIGEATAGLLPELLKKLILSLSFPKSMIWGDEDVRFVRPLRWLVALYGTEVIPFEIAHVRSGRISRGHRFLGAGDFEISAPHVYEQAAKEHFLIVDPEERKDMILQGLAAIAAEEGGTVIMDEDLLEEVVYLVEYPTPLCGSFDKRYLDLPEAAVITPMKDHQRYFPMRDGAGNLMNRFLTVRNGDAENLTTVRHGNERVLRARLDDAAFFFAEDRKRTLSDRIEGLKKIVFQDGLGTLFDKAQRLAAITVFLKNKVDVPVADEELERLSLLAKTDLLTQMVQEFTELQGIMGREYAALDGEGPAIAEALYEQYLPRFAGDDLPHTTMGMLLSVADKFDTITGMFSLDMVPTGSQDPFALRRQTIGILHILMNADWNINCDEVFAFILELLGTPAEKREEVMTNLHDYFTLRLKNIFQDKGFDYRIIDCVLHGAFLNAAEALKRAAALRDADFLSRGDLLQAYTRVGNMVKDAVETEVDPSLFETEEEKRLYTVVTELESPLQAAYATYDYGTAVTVLDKGVEAVNAFLDNVLVMHDNEAVRNNRIRLLTKTFGLISPLGDIKRLS